jgi:hypothetical protein
MAQAKKQTFFNTSWDKRAGWEKGVIIGGVVIGAILARRQFNVWREKLAAARQNAAMNQDALILTGQGQRLSHTATQYFGYADTLYTAMNSDWYNPFSAGTDEEGIQDVMRQMKSDLDVFELIKAFGKRDGYTLGEWLADEFSSSDKEFYINEPLRRNGVKFQF